MHKKDVLIAISPPFGAMEPPPYLNNAISVYSVGAHLFGKPGITASTAASTGSNCGLPRAIPPGGCIKFLVIALLQLIALRTIALNIYLKNKTIIPRYSICFMMRPTFIGTAVC